MRIFYHFKSIVALLALSLVVAAGCDDRPYQQQAEQFARETIIVDSHVDLPYRLRDDWEDPAQRTERGDFDYVRAREGGLDAPFMSIYIPVRYQDEGGAKALADSLIDMIYRLEENNPEKFAVATSPDQVRSQFEKGLVSLPMGMENGAGLEGDLENIPYFYDRGIRYITLAHAEDNRISDSSYDTTYTHNGLSSFGEKVVREMNRVGMMVDISHVTDSAFYDVMRITEAPAIASHSSCRAFTPGWERNMSDAMIRRLAENGGVIMINFGSAFLEQESRESGQQVREEIDRWLEENDLASDDPEARSYIRNYFRENYRYSTVTSIVDHIDHVVELTGIDHVGFGSDLDGVGHTLPEGMKDASDFPNIIEELMERGYSEEEIRKIAHGNIFRVWNRVREVSGKLQSQ